MISKTKYAIENFVYVPGVLQSIQKQMGIVAATEAGINHSEIRNITYDGMTGVCFDIKNHELKEIHMCLQNSAKFQYYILTEPNDVSKKKYLELMFSAQMPQKTPDDGGHDGASSSN
ncbi:hypothetical protein N665_0629s0013 [Sinapis alba]|nr:hypothetical protein N665_0629s0013 [Sinapis alba]